MIRGDEHAARKLVFGKINLLLDFCANPRRTGSKVTTVCAIIKRCFDHRKLAFGVQENNRAKDGTKFFSKKKGKQST